MQIREARDLISKSGKIIVVCGAGISTDAGIPDFKSSYKHNPRLKDALTL